MILLEIISSAHQAWWPTGWSPRSVDMYLRGVEGETNRERERQPHGDEEEETE
jgi:hypothetical protein